MVQGDVGLEDTYYDSDPMDVDLEHQQAEIDGKSVLVQHFIGAKWENECIVCGDFPLLLLLCTDD